MTVSKFVILILSGVVIAAVFQAVTGRIIYNYTFERYTLLGGVPPRGQRDFVCGTKDPTGKCDINSINDSICKAIDPVLVCATKGLDACTCVKKAKEGDDCHAFPNIFPRPKCQTLIGKCETNPDLKCDPESCLCVKTKAAQIAADQQAAIGDKCGEPVINPFTKIPECPNKRDDTTPCPLYTFCKLPEKGNGYCTCEKS